MNFMKFIKIGLALVVFALFTGVVSAQTTYYVDNQYGNNANSGLAGSPVADVAHALAAAPAGSIISIAKTPIDYADGDVTVTDAYTFTSSGGKPVFTSATFVVNASGKTVKVVGDLEFDGGLTLTAGSLEGGDKLWVKGLVTRTDVGSITVGQLNYADVTDFLYTTSAATNKTITTGLEFPVDADNANDVTTTSTGAGTLTLKLNQARTINGNLNLEDGADLNALTLTINGAGTHLFGADITNGTIALVQTANGGTFNGGAKLPNVTITDDAPATAYTAFVIGGVTPPTQVGNITVNSKASLTANIGGAIGNVTLTGSGAVITNSSATYTVGDVLASSGSAGTITLNRSTAGNLVSVKSIKMSGTGSITFGTNVTTTVVVTNDVTLDSTIPAFTNGTGSVLVASKAQITFPATITGNVSVGGNVTNSAVFSGTTDKTGNDNNGVIVFLNGGTLGVTKTVSLNITGSLATTAAGGSTANNNGLILLTATGATSTGDVENKSSVAITKGTGSTITNIANITSANITATKNITNSTSVYFAADCHNVDFSGSAANLAVTGSVYQTGSTKGGDILFGNGDLTVSADIKSDRGNTGADIIDGTAGAGAVTAKNIINSGKSNLTFVGSGNVGLTTGGFTSTGTGTTSFANLTGTFVAKTISIYDGVVDLGSVSNGTGSISANGAVVISGGTVYFGTGTPRTMTFSGSTIQFGSATTKPTFRASAGTQATGTEIVFAEPVPNVNQTISFGLLETVWPGNFTVNNGATLPAPYVTMTSVDGTNPGAFRVVGGTVTFNNGAAAVYNTVMLDRARLFVGQNNVNGSGGINGDFDNITGYQTSNGGFVMMSGGVAGQQIVNATGAADASVRFGNFGVDNNSGTAGPAGVITISNPAVFAGDFYLATGKVNVTNLSFDGPEPYPTIYKTLGEFLSAPTFTSFVNVTYYNNDQATAFEIPDASVADKLWNLTVATTNGAKAGYGIVTLSTDATVNGKLSILAKQSLYTAAQTLILNGSSVQIDGYLVDDGSTRVQVAADSVAFTGTGVLPSLQINNGSLGNTLVGYQGIYSDAFGGDGKWGTNPGADDFTTADGNITFETGADDGSSLSVNFTAAASGAANFGSLTMAGNDTDETFSLGANAVMSGSITLGDGATNTAGTIALGDFKLTHKGTAFNMTAGNITSSATGSLEFTTANTNLTFPAVASYNASIAANVTFNANGIVNAPVTSDATIKGNVLVNGSSSVTCHVYVPDGRVLTLAGSSVTITSPSNMTVDPAAVAKTGIVKLDRDGAVGTSTLTLTTPATTIANLTVADNVTLAGAVVTTPGTLTVSTDLVHSGGLFTFGAASVQVDGKFTRTAGTYAGDGWFIWNGTAGNFKHSNVADAGAMTINSLQVKTALALQNNVALNVVKTLYLNGNNLVNQVGTSASLVTVGDATNVPTVKVNGASTVTANALTFGNANADFYFEGASLTSDKLYWPLTATLARDVTLNMTANTNTVTLGASNTINRNVTLTQGILVWDKGTTITLGTGSIITRTNNGGLNKNANGDADSGTFTAPNVSLVYVGDINSNASATVDPTKVSGIEYSDPTIVTDITVGKTGNANKSTVTMVPARQVDGKITLINGTTSGQTSTITFSDNTTLIAAQTISSGILNIAAGKTLTLSNTGATTLPTVTGGTVSAAGPLTITGFTGGTLTANDNLTINGAFAAGTINASKNVTLGANGTLAAGTNLAFVGSASSIFTVPSAGAAISTLTINKDAATNTVTLSGGDLTVGNQPAAPAAYTGGVTFVNGLFVTGSNTLTIPQPNWGFGQGFDRTGVTGSKVSHVVGKVAKTTKNNGGPGLGGSSESRIEFPVGTTTLYRPAVLNFNPAFGGIPTVPNGTFTVSHVSMSPSGAVGLPIANGVAEGISVARYPNFYWNIQSEPSINNKQFDLELTATGFTDYDDLNNVRIIRRHGTITDEENQWWLQGTNDSYNNELSSGVLTAIQLGAQDGLRSGGAIFTLGIKSNMSVANTIAKQWLVVKDGAKSLDISKVFTGNSGSLSFAAQSSNVSVATVSVSGSTLKITPLTIGDAVVTIVANDAANNDFFAYSFDVNVNTVGVETEELPTTFALYQNYPNPFNPTTNIKFDLPKESNVSVKIYNILGEEVVTLVNKVMPAGRHAVEFNASKLTSGMYIYRIEADNFVQVKKMLLMK